jgi:hypothetical protein
MSNISDFFGGNNRIERPITATLTVDDLSDKVITNYGQTADIVYTLENPINGGVLAIIQIEEEEAGSIKLIPPSSSYFILNGTVLEVDESVILSSPIINDVLVLRPFKIDTESFIWMLSSKEDNWIVYSYIVTPTNSSPSDGDTDVGETPTLVSSAFDYEGDSDTHLSSDWEVYDGVTLIYSSYDDTINKTSLTVPAGNLEADTEYTWRVRHTGTTHGDSEWSMVTGFTTAASFEFDLSQISDAEIFESAASNYFSVSVINETSAIVCYRDHGNSYYGTACLLDWSGGSIVADTPVVFNSADSYYIFVSVINETSAIVCYRDSGNNRYGTSCLVDWSTGTIIPDTPVVFESADSQYISAAVINETSAIVCYKDGGNSYGTACLLDWSTGTIIPDIPVVFESANSLYISVSVINETSAIVCYSDFGNNQYGTACLLDWSTGTIIPDTPVVFNSANSYYISVAVINETSAIVCYKDGGNSYYGTACLLDWSTGTIIPDTPVVFESANSSYISAAVINETSAIVCYQDYGNNSYGTARLLG